jgi:GH25 family lysozyme M1 (1,4-beta-N-acetylmuramidase)
LVVIAMMIIGTSVYLGLRGNSGGNLTAEPDQTLIYSQEDLDASVEKVREEMEAEAEEEAAEAYQQGVTDGRLALLRLIEEKLLGGNSVVETLRPLYEGKVVLVSNGMFHFVPIDYSLAQSELVQDNLQVTDTGEYRYVRDGEVISHKGIDVSKHQGDIDWSKVAEDGVEFAIIRCLFRGYGSGALVEDDTFAANMEGAIDNGIHVGVYVFTQAINEEEMLEEAQQAIEMTSQYATSVPIVVDVERVAGANPRMDSLSVEERTRLVRLFCDTVSAAGFKPYIYFNTEMSILYLNLNDLQDIPKWYASYTETMFYPYHYDIWQYSDRGSVSGIQGDVDLNISFSEFWAE